MAISSVNNGKRTFDELRNKILSSLSSGRKTVNEVSTLTGINWKTVDNHLIYLLGRRYVNEVLYSPYVRIYEISNEGKAIINGEHQKSKTKKSTTFRSGFFTI